MESTRPEVHSIAVELTAQCNQKCSYCYNAWRDDGGAAQTAHDAELLLKRVDRLLTELTVHQFTLTGGEPLQSRALWPLLERLAATPIETQIISNGTLATERVATRLASFQVESVQISLNGPDEAVHARHVGEGFFQQTLSGIRALVGAGVPVVGCVVVTRLNAARLAEILDLWLSLGVHAIALSRFSPAGYATKQAAQLLPSRADLMQAFEQAQPYARDRDMRLSCTMPVPPCMFDVATYAPIEFGHCPIGTSAQQFALGTDGRLRQCPLYGAAISSHEDIATSSIPLRDIIGGPEVARYREKVPSFCDGCVHADTCGGGCGAAAQAMLGADSRRQPDPILWQHVDETFEKRLAVQDPSRRSLQLIS